MKKLFIFLLLGLFMISSVSAITWDNIAYYKLDETTGAVVDATGNYDGTNDGATRGVTGKINNAFDFDGIDNNVLTSTMGDFGSNLDNGFSISFWTKTTSTAEQSFGGSQNVTTISIPTNWAGDGQVGLFLRDEDANVLSFRTGDTNFNDGDWHNIVITTTTGNTNGAVYFDGVNQSINYLSQTDPDNFNNLSYPFTLGAIYDDAVIKNFFDGSLDEIGIWNRELTEAEITDLWNSGIGITYEGSGLLSINLESPINGTTIADVGTNFTVIGSNLSSVEGTWQNITYYVWKNSTLVNESTVSITGETFNETLFIDDFIRTDYEWNAQACYTNVTGGYCINATNNNTFTVSLYTLVEENWINDTISGTLETFNLSIDLFPGIDLTDATFYYEGVARTPNIIAEDDNRFILVSDYQIPLVTSDVNNSFYWELEFNTDETKNTTSVIQLVRAMFLDNCDIYTNRLFNISLFDELNKNSLNGNIELIYTILNSNYETIKVYNFSAESVNNTYVCSALNLTDEDLYYSAELRYISDGYVPELYNIQRAKINTDNQQINLYDLNSSSSTEFKVTYQDSTFNFVEGAIVQLQRKYISENLYETVEAPLTSRDGIAVLHIDLDSVKYRATVVKNGVVLDEFDNLVFKCQSELTGECEQKLLGTIDPRNNIDLDTSRDFSYLISRNESIITLSFTVPSGTPSSVNMILDQKDQFGSSEMCNQTILSSAGSISCTFNDTIGDSYIDLRIYKDGVPMAIETFIIPESNGVDFLGNNFIIIVVLLLSVVGMALTSPEWIIINGIIVMVVAGALWLVNGLNFVMGLGSLMWLIIAAGILIFKLAKQEDR